MHEYSDNDRAWISRNSEQIFPERPLLEFGPKRKQAAFVKEEELNCMLEDRAGTPHLSELQHDEDVTAALQVEELGLAGKVDTLLAGEI